MFKQIFTRQVLIAGAAFGLSLCFLALLFQLFIAPNIIFENETRMQIEITAAPPELMTQAAVESSPTMEIFTEEPVLPGVFATGMTIVISGTEGEGLNLRQTPGTDSPVVYLAQENETYTISDGPQIKDGLIWWYISQTADNPKMGWAVQDYFKPDDQ